MESLLWSDDDCSQDVDVTTNPDEEVEESDFEIVRCVCEVKEENDFMIQVWSGGAGVCFGENSGKCQWKAIVELCTGNSCMWNTLLLFSEIIRFFKETDRVSSCYGR